MYDQKLQAYAVANFKFHEYRTKIVDSIPDLKSVLNFIPPLHVSLRFPLEWFSLLHKNQLLHTGSCDHVVWASRIFRQLAQSNLKPLAQWKKCHKLVIFAHICEKRPILAKLAYCEEVYICWLFIYSFPRKYKNPMQLYKMIKPARLVQKCFETSILYIGEPHASLVQELRSRETAYDEPTYIFLYF